ncbi:MAG: type II and III secretion system protein, partial [Verrucomicrobia bacterium]
AALRFARQLASQARFQEAQSVLQTLLQYSPAHLKALRLQKKLKDDKVFNQTLTPQYVQQVKRVGQLLYEARQFHRSGQYDEALKRYEQVLSLDKYHFAARRGLQDLEKSRMVYSETAYDERRSQFIADVDKAWQRPVTRYHTELDRIVEQPQLKIQGAATIHRKLDTIIIPHVNFRDSPLREALQYVRQRAATLDIAESDPTRRGVNIILKADPESEQANIPITLQLTDVPLRNVLLYLMEGANMKLKVETHAVLAVPLSESTENLITKEYQVASSFFSQLPELDTPSAPELPLASGHSLAPGSQPTIVARSGAKEFLESQGITFPPGASANYLPSSSRLIVKNTQANLDLIESLVDQTINSVPKQINIEAKFVEITQDNAEELGFDWLLGQFQLPFGSGVSASGGNSRFESPGKRNPQYQNFPIQDAEGIPVGMSKQGTGSLTGGNRSGSLALQLNAMDTLFLGSGAAVVTPGILALAGVFTAPQFQLVIRALHQKKGADLLTAPSVMTKSGCAARIQIVREFRYPTQFDPPQVPPTQTFGISPLTPATPTEFATKNVGVELDVTPTVGPDGNTIDLILQPRVTEFEGFINYGSQIDTVAPITSSLGIATGATATVKLSDNTIHQPVFSIREASTQVTITNGSTVVLGGLIQEKIQKVQDKTPILGDIPLFGRLFRSNTERRVKTNLVMFVTARLIDPSRPSAQEQSELPEV